MKQLIILSSKSTGSTALLKYISSFTEIKEFSYIQHNEGESLFWTKVASVLSLDQDPMYRSIIPLSKERALEELNEFVGRNISSLKYSLDTKESCFQVYHDLVSHFQPTLVEKSPHHVYQWSNITLLNEYINHFPDTQTLVIGLVRHPMDVMYSAWKRWKFIPEEFEYEWIRSYENLLKSKALFKEKLLIIRYEDLTKGGTFIELYNFLGISGQDNHQTFFNTHSIGSWKYDPYFSYQPSQQLIDLARTYGYPKNGILNPHRNIFWPIIRKYYQARYRASRLKNMIMKHR